MTTLRLRHVFAAALGVCLLALGATDAHATHFRYGTIRWKSYRRCRQSRQRHDPGGPGRPGG